MDQPGKRARALYVPPKTTFFPRGTPERIFPKVVLPGSLGFSGIWGINFGIFRGVCVGVQEDEELRQLVEEHGEKKWTHISSLMGTRKSSKQVRRYLEFCGVCVCVFLLCVEISFCWFFLVYGGKKKKLTVESVGRYGG